MAGSEQKRLEDYFTPEKPITSDVDALSNPRLDPNKDRIVVNELVLNIVIKYIAKYFKLSTSNLEQFKAQAIAKGEMSPEELAQIFVMGFAATQGVSMPISESLANHSLLDVKSTAAIFKEIVFNQRFDKNGYFLGVDIGAGSGILMLASYIAGTRGRVRDATSVFGCDVNTKNVAEAQRVLSSIAGDRTFTVQNIDALHPQFWSLFEGLPVSQWISETVGLRMPRMDVKNGGVDVVQNDRIRSWRLMNRCADPFPDVLINTVKNRRGFLNDVKSGRIAMFPDLVNGDFVPDFDKSHLRLRTSVDPSKYVSLDKVGDEFSGYEVVGKKDRWSNTDDVDDPNSPQTAALNKVGELLLVELGDLMGKGKRR